MPNCLLIINLNYEFHKVKHPPGKTGRETVPEYAARYFS
jgi:hypothetical protein